MPGVGGLACERGPARGDREEGDWSVRGAPRRPRSVRERREGG